VPQLLEQLRCFNFTGASKKGKPGLFEIAQKGTLFLDEIGELPLNLQVKILRFLETREITRVGDYKPFSVDVRILAATNRDLEAMVNKGEFREDLYYRLNVVQIKIPPLRERIDDVGPLSFYYLNQFNSQYNQKKRMSYDVLKEMQRYDWPGNIRELKNVIEHMVVVSNGQYFDVNDLPFYKGDYEPELPVISVSGIIPLSEAVAEVEKQILSSALKQCKSTRNIAKMVKMNQSTVVRKMKKYGLSSL